MLILTLVAGLLLVLLIKHYKFLKQYWRMVRLGKKFPGPKTVPILGNAHILWGIRPDEAFSKVLEIVNEHGDIVGLWLGPFIFCLFMLNTKSAETVLSSQDLLVKSSEYSLFANWLCEGLLISRPKKWFKRRKILTAAFHFSILEQFIETFDRNARIFVQNLQKAVSNEGLISDMDHWVNLATLDIICVFFKELKTFIRLLYLAQKYVGPTPWPLLGNANLFLGAQPQDILRILSDIFNVYGKTVKFWFGLKFCIFLLEPKDVAFVLNTNSVLNKSTEYDVLRNWLCEGLLVSKPRKWFRRRKVLTPAFHFKILAHYIEIFDRMTSVFVKNLYKASEEDNGLIVMDDWVHLATLDVICETAMGVSVNAQTNVDSEYVRAVKTISTVLHKRMFDILYRFNLTYQFTKLARDEKKALSILHGFTEKIIVKRRAELLKAKDKLAPTQSDEVGSKRKMAFLDILLQSEIDGKPLTNLDIREEVDTFMFEGHDTTSSAITFCFYNLAMYPKCQQKCFEEIVQVLGKDKSKAVSYEDLNNLHYVELCIKETLRLYPSVPLLGRKVTEECEINGKIVPAGTNVGISPLHLGRQEELFPEATIFKPERFEKDYTADKMSPYAYIPFSAGPRNCIGQKFAMLEIKTVVANVLRHYELDYAGNKEEELLLIAELILRPKDPLRFKIKPRLY